MTSYWVGWTVTIFVLKDGKKGELVDPTPIAKETLIEKFVANNPESVFYDINEDKNILIVKRQFSTEHGRSDILGIDKDGKIYIAETKLHKNPDRRQVLSQVIDYGASLWRTNFSDFRTEIEYSVQEIFKMSLKEKLARQYDLEEDEVERLLENIARNFSDATFNFVIIMDTVDERLLKLVLYVNQNSNFSIFPVDMKYYKFDNFEIVIPKLHGTEIKKTFDANSSGARKELDPTSFFEEAASNLNTEEIQALQKLYDFSDKVADRVDWGSSFQVYFDKISPRKSLYYVYPNGKLVFNSHMLHETPEAQRYRDEFKEKLSRIRGITIPDGYPESSPKFSIDVWYPVVDDFINAVKDLIK